MRYSITKTIALFFFGISTLSVLPASSMADDAVASGAELEMATSDDLASNVEDGSIAADAQVTNDVVADNAPSPDSAPLVPVEKVMEDQPESQVLAMSSVEAEASDSIVITSEQHVALSTTEMADDRGASGYNDVTSDQTLAATTAGNSFNVGGNVTNGTIGIGDNVNAFGSYVMNTGNNTAINSAVTVNLQMTTSP